LRGYEEGAKQGKVFRANRVGLSRRRSRKEKKRERRRCSRAVQMNSIRSDAQLHHPLEQRNRERRQFSIWNTSCK
jgi:hypothetical protein